MVAFSEKTFQSKKAWPPMSEAGDGAFFATFFAAPQRK